ncbi:MAG: hypothetical protein M3Z21_13960 [Pseudomonadota bacterium]|nr:hypothetical protein [Pseudomonadota bacterium]
MARPAGARNTTPSREEEAGYIRLLRSRAAVGDATAAAALVLYRQLARLMVVADHPQEGGHGR